MTPVAVRPSQGGCTVLRQASVAMVQGVDDGANTVASAVDEITGG